MSETHHLYLLRHAKSSWDDPSQPDHDRPLADRGRTAVKVLARYVEQHEIDPDLVLCSSAKRTQDTLEGVMPGHPAVVEHELFVAGYDQLLQRLRQVEPEERIVRRAITRQVNDMAPAIVRRVSEVRVLDGADERKRRVIHVDPIELR